MERGFAGRHSRQFHTVSTEGDGLPEPPGTVFSHFLKIAPLAALRLKRTAHERMFDQGFMVIASCYEYSDFPCRYFSPPKLEKMCSVRFGESIQQVHGGVMFTHQGVNTFL